MALTRDEKATLFSPSMAGTLRLMGYLALACVMMVVDHHGHWLAKARYGAASVIQPVYQLAGLPARGLDAMEVAFASRTHMAAENRQLRRALLLANARLNRMSAVVRQNNTLKQLMQTQHQLGMKVELARLIDVDLGPYRHRAVLNIGAHQGVKVGQVVIDAHGIFGQVVEVLPDTCVVMLVTDPDSAVPVVVARTGQRGVAFGSRTGSLLNIPDLPLASDIKAGDQLLTSGLGGRFPPGFPVGHVTKVGPDPAGTFLAVTVQPAAHLTRSTHVLLLRDLAPPVGPPGLAAPVGPPASLAPPEIRARRGTP